MTDVLSQLPALTETQRTRALERFSILRSALEDGISQTEVARNHGLPLRTIQRWVNAYRQHGLAGLARKGRSDQGKRRGLPPDLVRLVEGLALQKPQKSVAAIHRQVTKVAVD